MKRGPRPRRSAMAMRAAAWAIGPLCVMLLPVAALALINPKYTVVDLVRDSNQILVVRVSAPRDGKMSGEVTGALAGQAPAEPKAVFDYSEAENLTEEKIVAAFGGAKTALAVVCIHKKKQENTIVGAMEIGTTWMGLTHLNGNVWKLDEDPNGLETVWGGSARTLIPAIRYTSSDPAPEFPVAANLAWGNDLALGQLGGPAHGCLVTGDGLILLSEGGDRVYQPGTKDAKLVDVTGKLGLTTKSRRMAAGDFDGDGRMDIACWDGARLMMYSRDAAGRFSAPPCGFDLTECLSLSALDASLVIGSAKGAMLFRPNGAVGALTELAGGAGPCAVADFNDDGAPDIMQVSAQELTLRAGTTKPGVFAPPVTMKIAVLKEPREIVCGDYDTDGQLDMMVAGAGGTALLSRQDGQWISTIAETGELGAASKDEVQAVGACLSDLNGDGRQAVAFFDASTAPGLYFNRGFACFGVARTLAFGDAKLPAAEALGNGQMAGLVWDLNGDLSPDLLAVDRQQKVWCIHTVPTESRRFQLTIEPRAKGPLTVTVSLAARALGMWVARPGEPTVIALPKAGKVTLRWKEADGTPKTREVVVTGRAQVQL